MQLITRLWNTFFSSDIVTKEREENITPFDTAKSDIGERKSCKYDSDIANIEAFFGPLKTGLCITTTLKELLDVCPRKRRRIEAYQGLTNYLDKKYGITLIIKSRKTK